MERTTPKGKLHIPQKVKQKLQQKQSKEKKKVLNERIFQIGITKQKKFVKMNKHMQNNDMFLAALEMKNSLWYKQTPKRVDGLIRLLLKNEYEKKR